MAIFRIKDYVPEVYVAESRDFQIFTRVFDLIQNSCKYDIDSILNIIDSDTIPTEYVEHLKSKVGFYTNNVYEETQIKFVLSAFPHMVRYKGSKLGIVRCVNTFLKLSGIRGTPEISVDNDNYSIKIGLDTNRIDTTLLEDMLRYIIPTGYSIDLYFFDRSKFDDIKLSIEEYTYVSDLDSHPYDTMSVRSGTLDGTLTSQEDQDKKIDKDSLYNTVGLSAVGDCVIVEEESDGE